MFDAQISPHRSVAFFHDIGERVTHDIGLLAIYGSRTDLCRVKSVRYGDAECRVDHSSQLIEIVGSHRDPLYLVHAEGRDFIEIGLYGLRPEDREVVIELDEGPSHTIAMGACCDFSVFAQTPLVSSAVPAADGGQMIWMLSQHPVEVVDQRVICGRFEERRRVYGPGRHRITYSPDPSPSYFGVSLNVRLPTGYDYEHKHVFHGRL